ALPGTFAFRVWRTRAPRELSAPFQAIGYASLFYGLWPQLSRFKLVLAIACVGRMALTNIYAWVFWWRNNLTPSPPL
ncbi:DUF418 domain-containing protein, partial [Escherichia coli]|nr:DUF418 domain-containing protein [Escherichia coli]